MTVFVRDMPVCAVILRSLGTAVIATLMPDRCLTLSVVMGAIDDWAMNELDRLFDSQRGVATSAQILSHHTTAFRRWSPGIVEAARWF
jgi:hypothetical protein